MGRCGRTVFHASLVQRSQAGVARAHDERDPTCSTGTVCTRYNSGEPWYAGLGQSQTLYRLKANFLHAQPKLNTILLGWFSIRSEPTTEDAEWALRARRGL